MPKAHPNVVVRAVTVSQSTGFHSWLAEPLAGQGYRPISLSSEGPQLQTLEAMGWQVEIVPMARRIALKSDIRSLGRIIKIFRRLRPVMVHSMTPKAGLLCMIAARLCKVPVRVHTFTGLVFPTSTGLKRLILMLTDGITCACATHVIAEGAGVRHDLLSHGITRKLVRVLGYGNVNGVDMQRFNPDDVELQTEVDKIRHSSVFTFVFVGRIVGDKGLNELAVAFKRMHSERSDVRLILVGRLEKEFDPLKQETLSFFETCPQVEMVGQQADVRPWLVAADALVFPSYREGFPNVVLEAGAMGLPSIVTDINGSREIIESGRNGWIIPPRDSDALYQAMSQLANNPQEAKRMGEAARPIIAERYEQSFVQACLLDYYKEILPLS